MNVREDSGIQVNGDHAGAPQKQPFGYRGWLEILFILILFFVVHGDLPPGVNESHYLAKAKHYWNPHWCPQDHFLKSADAHLVFYWTVGYLTKWLSMTSVIWIGRLAVWTLLAVGWFRLTRAIFDRPGSGLLTAAFYLLLLDRAQLAGEWVVGGLEAKGIAYGFVFLAMEAIVVNRWRRGWVLLGAAALFHVLVGGWCTIAAGFAWLLAPADRCKLTTMFPFMLIGGCLALPGVIPAMMLTSGVSAEDVAVANDIYVYERLPHHLLATNFSTRAVFSHLAMLAGWVALLVFDRKRWEGPYRRLVTLVLGAVLISGLGLSITLILSHPSALAASLLRYYWYRLADALVPIGLVFAVARVVQQWAVASPRFTAWTTSLLIIGAGWYVITGFVEVRMDPRPAADRQTLPRAPAGPAKTQEIYRDWVKACLWIRKETPVDAIFVTPRRQQTFKWYAHRAEVVNRKDVPQDAEALIEWDKRMDSVYVKGVRHSGFASLSRKELVTMMRTYKARYIVRPRFEEIPRLPLKMIYPPPDQHSFYEVYELSR